MLTMNTHLLIRKAEKQRQTHIHSIHPLVHFLNPSQQSGVGQAKSSNQELSPGLSHYCCLPAPVLQKSWNWEIVMGMTPAQWNACHLMYILNDRTLWHKLIKKIHFLKMQLIFKKPVMIIQTSHELWNIPIGSKIRSYQTHLLHQCGNTGSTK